MTDNFRTTAVGGSFRDPTSRVYTVKSDHGGETSRILRGLNREMADHCHRLMQAPFFVRLLGEKRIVGTITPDGDDPAVKDIVKLGWEGVLEHEVVPFVSYPYEWSFGMLRTAALLHLRILEDALKEGWILKDSTPFNIQFLGSQPMFIDLPSFVPWDEGEAWLGYRQFCSNFLTPLMMRAYLGIDHLPLLRSYIDGIPPVEAKKYFVGISRFRPGVMSHVLFPAMVENRIAAKERDGAEAKSRPGKPQTRSMVLGLVQSLTRLVRSLKISLDHTDWSDYDQTHSYSDIEQETKKAFVQKVVASAASPLVWDIGCNTGTFSAVSSPHASQVIAIDGDHNAVEKLYQRQKASKGSNILPLVMNLANISPAQGWAGIERMAFDDRGNPDIVLALALVHHIRISANVPLDMFFDWLNSLGSEVVVEFVDRHDEMVVKLLTNKSEQFADYNRENFVAQAKRHFRIKESTLLKDGKREIFHMVPI
jgi:SAM-dependent methyltransferase